MKKYTFALLSVLLVAVGCQREVTPDNEGETITFSASTSYEQDNLETKGPGVDFFAPETKTAFSGRDENDALFNADSKKERIDWQVGDKIFVNMVSDGTSKTAVYTVGGYQTSSGADKTVSETTSLTTGTPITATGIGQREFLATYPADNSIITSQISNGIFAFKMPEGNLGYTLDKSGNNDEHVVVSDNMDYAVMVARASSSDSNVQLHFKPYFNAYQFILGNAPLNYTLTKVTLSCTSGYLRTKDAATVQGSIKDNGDQNSAIFGSASDYSQSITYDFTQAPGYTQLGGITLQRETGTIDITLLALPVAQSGISITFYLKQLESSDEPTPFTYTLPADKTLQPFHKLRINGIGGSNPIVWTYELEIDDVTPMPAGVASTAYKVRSYKWYEDDKGVRHEERVAWKTQINLGDRNNAAQADWRDIASYSPDNTRLPGGWIGFASTANGEGRTSSEGWESRTLTAQSRTITTTNNSPEDYHQAALGSHVHPSGINNLFSSANAIDLSMYDIQGYLTSRNTANCYVVRGPGWYKIPLVYGNGIKGGKSNMPSPSNLFVNHTGAQITQPSISQQTGISSSAMTAEVIWTDYWNSEKGHGLVSEVSIEGEYLLFNVPQNTIHPGNTLLAVKSGGVILWSWHIWITDQALYADPHGYLTANVGWVDISLKQAAYHPFRGEMLRIVQLEGEATHDFGVIQNGSDLYVEGGYELGRYTYFQYGRKDPIFPAQVANNNRTQTIWDGGGNVIAGNNGSMNSMSMSSYAQTIQNPSLFNTNNIFAEGQWGSTKTLYDPSPAGFKVLPNFNGWRDSFPGKKPGQSGYIKVYPNDYAFRYPGGYVGSDGTMFIGVCGYRDENAQLVGTPKSRNDYWDAKAYYWAADGTCIGFGRDGQVITASSYNGYTWAVTGNKHQGYGVRPVVDN